MVNYRGPPGKKWTDAEAEYLRTHPHTHYTDPVTGDLMIYEVPKDPQETLLSKVKEEATTKRNKELERDALQWKQYYKDNQGKIPGEFPTSIFDKKKVTDR